MKKLFCTAALALCGAAAGLPAQNLPRQELPRLAVVEFSANNRAEKTQQDTITVRNLTESQMVNSGKYQVIARADIDKMLADQKIAVSAISSTENVKKLQLMNISYIVTGTVDAIGADYAVSVKMLDVSSGKFTHSDDEFIGGASPELYTGVSTLIKRFNEGMSAGEGGTIVQGSAAQAFRQGAVPEGFVLVEGGTFQMGSTSGRDNEKPVHSVTVKSFHLGKYPVTQKEWREVMGNNPSNFKGDNLPVERVSWHEAVEYCNQRSIKEKLTPAYRGSGNSITCDWSASGYRLPTEAEWEYAARGGSKEYLTTAYSGSNSIDAVAWYTRNSGGTTHPVGTKAPNALGIYDMSGNVWEWCWDWYGAYESGAQTGPMGASSGSYRVDRGGSWYSSADIVRSAYRDSDSPSIRFNDLGFRLVRP